LTDNAKAAGFLLISSGVFTLMELFAKQLIAYEQMSPIQVLWIRSVFTMVALPIMLRTSPLRLARTRHIGKQAARSMCLVAAGLAFFFSLYQVPLADAVTIVFVSPLFVTAIAALVLKELVGVRRWTACAIGFVGALLIIQPGMEGRHWMYFLPLIDAAMSAVYVILTRMVGRDDSWGTSLFYSVAAMALLGTFALPWVWIWPNQDQWLLLLGISAIGLVAHQFHIRAFSLGEASLLAPLSYVHIIFTTVAAFVVFGTLPDEIAMVGVVMIVGAGIYVLHRERQLRRAARSAQAKSHRE
jgi:drug/metabolite transporter (DMT)-like permease